MQQLFACFYPLLCLFIVAGGALAGGIDSRMYRWRATVRIGCGERWRSIRLPAALGVLLVEVVEFLPPYCYWREPGYSSHTFVLLLGNIHIAASVYNNSHRAIQLSGRVCIEYGKVVIMPCAFILRMQLLVGLLHTGCRFISCYACRQVQWPRSCPIITAVACGIITSYGADQS